MGTVGEIGERAIIERIRARLAPAARLGGASGSATTRRCCARSGTAPEVITTDALVEGVHFDRAYVPPAAIGHKALAVNLSDLAAMGAEPRAALLSLVLPSALPVDDLDAMVDGLLALAATPRRRAGRRQHHPLAGPAGRRRDGDGRREAAPGADARAARRRATTST